MAAGVFTGDVNHPMSTLSAHSPAILADLNIPSASPPLSAVGAARSFVWTAVLAYVSCLALLAAFSIYANPWGNYGESGFLDPHEYNDRLVKAKHLDALPVSRRPQVLILGSSSMMSMRGHDIAKATRRTAFNCNVSGGQADDHLCILRHLVHDLNYRPELLIVGVETWTFGPPAEMNAVIPGARRVLVNVPQWIRHHPHGQWYRRAWAKMVDCFSRDHLNASWRVLFKLDLTRRNLDALGTGIVSADGSLVYSDHDSMKLGGVSQTLAELRQHGVTKLLEQIRDGRTTDRLERLRYYRFDGLWSPRVERFTEFLQICQRERIKVLLVRTPLHPLAWEMLEDHQGHARNVAELAGLTDKWQREFPVLLGIVDASHVENYGGDPDDYYDEMHCGPENSKRILAKVAAFLESR